MSKKTKRNRTKRNLDKNDATDSTITRSQLRKNNKVSWWPRILKTTVIVFLCGVLAALAYGAKVFVETDSLLENAYQPVKRNTTINDDIDPIKDPIAILILGVDNNDDRQLESTRTDAMLLATVSPITQKISLVSIPRDTYTQINSPTFVGMEKINAAYAFGEVESSIDAVENLMNIPINYYMTVDFKAFEEIVDVLDGVEAEVPVDFVEQNAAGKEVVSLKKGLQKLNGEQALAFARTRKIDNDVMRGSRQQEIMQAVLKKGMKLGSVTKLTEVMTALDGHFWTDMDMNTMMKVAQSGITSSYDFDSYIFSWLSFDYYGSSMVGLHGDSLDYISHRLRLSLGLDEADERDVEGYEFVSNGLISEKTFPLDGMAIINP